MEQAARDLLFCSVQHAVRFGIPLMSHASTPNMQPVLGRSSSSAGPGFHSQIWGIQQIVARLGICESRRRLLHMVPGFFPVLLWFIPHQDPWGPLLIGLTIAISLTTVAFALLREDDFARPNETLWHLSVMGYSLPVLAMLILLPGRSELGLMTLGVVAFGDGSAALGGKLFRGRRLPWNRRKTWAGLACFVLAGTLGASFNYWVDARPSVHYVTAFCIAGVAAVAGAIVESLPIRSHDNFRVGVTAALTGLAMHILLLGW